MKEVNVAYHNDIASERYFDYAYGLSRDWVG